MKCAATRLGTGELASTLCGNYTLPDVSFNNFPKPAEVPLDTSSSFHVCYFIAMVKISAIPSPAQPATNANAPPQASTSLVLASFGHTFSASSTWRHAPDAPAVSLFFCLCFWGEAGGGGGTQFGWSGHAVLRWFPPLARMNTIGGARSRQPSRSLPICSTWIPLVFSPAVHVQPAAVANWQSRCSVCCLVSSSLLAYLAG